MQPLSALEEQLRCSDPIVAQAARAQALAQLDALTQRLQSSLSKGVTTADYPHVLAALDACQACREVLTTYSPTSS